jgi:hypothetical protein
MMTVHNVRCITMCCRTSNRTLCRRDMRVHCCWQQQQRCQHAVTQGAVALLAYIALTTDTAMHASGSRVPALHTLLQLIDLQHLIEAAQSPRTRTSRTQKQA